MRRKLQSIIQTIKAYPLRYLLDRTPARSAIEKDVQRWVQMFDSSRLGDTFFENLRFLLFAADIEEFRNLLYYRLGSPSGSLAGFFLALSKQMYKARSTLCIATPSVGGGLIIMHGLGTVIDAEQMGENCLIFQDVVIGTKNEADDRPTIGNYVHISVGSKVLGKITIGDHAVIAANSVVTKDMPPNSLALGIPARIVREAGNRAEYIADGTISA